MKLIVFIDSSPMIGGFLYCQNRLILRRFIVKFSISTTKLVYTQNFVGPQWRVRKISQFSHCDKEHIIKFPNAGFLCKKIFTLDARWTLKGLRDVLLTSNLTKLKKLHLQQNEIWWENSPKHCSFARCIRIILRVISRTGQGDVKTWCSCNYVLLSEGVKLFTVSLRSVSFPQPGY